MRKKIRQNKYYGKIDPNEIPSILDKKTDCNAWCKVKKGISGLMGLSAPALKIGGSVISTFAPEIGIPMIEGGELLSGIKNKLDPYLMEEEIVVPSHPKTTYLAPDYTTEIIDRYPPGFKQRKKDKTWRTAPPLEWSKPLNQNDTILPMNNQPPSLTSIGEKVWDFVSSSKPSNMDTTSVLPPLRNLTQVSTLPPRPTTLDPGGYIGRKTRKPETTNTFPLAKLGPKRVKTNALDTLKQNINIQTNQLSNTISNARDNILSKFSGYLL